MAGGRISKCRIEGRRSLSTLKLLRPSKRKRTGSSERINPSLKTMTHLTKIKSFTLLEIILVIALVSMIDGVVGWQIGSSLNRYAFAREVEEVYGSIKQAQVLSLTYRTDIDVHF